MGQTYYSVVESLCIHDPHETKVPRLSMALKTHLFHQCTVIIGESPLDLESSPTKSELCEVVSTNFTALSPTMAATTR